MRLDMYTSAWARWWWLSVLLEGLVCWMARKSVGSMLPAFFYGPSWACLAAVFVARRVVWLAWRRRLASVLLIGFFFVCLTSDASRASFPSLGFFASLFL
jgi:hypothetical protein